MQRSRSPSSWIVLDQVVNHEGEKLSNQLMASAKSTSLKEMGFDNGKMMGRALIDDMSLTTSSVKAF
jgi:hypothetical protein